MVQTLANLAGVYANKDKRMIELMHNIGSGNAFVPLLIWRAFTFFGQ